MTCALALVFSIAALLASGCVQTIRTTPVALSSKDIAAIDAAYKSRKLAIIWDAHTDVHIRVTAKDAVTRAAVPNAAVALLRDRRVKRGADGRTYPDSPPTKTDSEGHAALQATFPAAGDVNGGCIFVCDSYVRVVASGYKVSKARVSPMYRIDFPREKNTHVVTLTVELITHE